MHVFSRSLRSENAGFPKSRRVIGEHVSYPLLGSERVTRTAGAAAGISGRVIFAAFLGREAQKCFRKNSDSPQAFLGKKLAKIPWNFRAFCCLTPTVESLLKQVKSL